MIIAPFPANEARRLEALRHYEILDTPPEAVFDRMTTLAARLFGTPVALISLVDSDRQWIKSCHGLQIRQTSRNSAFCAHTILGTDSLVVPDARCDPRFSGNPLVTHDPHIRFYAGVPLTTRDGDNLGALCLIDWQARTLSPAERATLETLGALVAGQFEHRLTERRLARTEAIAEEAAAVLAHTQGHAFFETFTHHLMRVLGVEGECSGPARATADAAPLLLWQSGSDALYTFFNRPWLQFTGRSLEAELGDGWSNSVHPEDLASCVNCYWYAFQRQEPFRREFRLKHRDGRYRWMLDMGMPRWTENGQFAGYSGFCLDISDRKQREEADLVSTWSVDARLQETVRVLRQSTANARIAVQLLKKANLDSRHAHYLQLVEEESARWPKLLNSFFKSESKK